MVKGPPRPPGHGGRRRVVLVSASWVIGLLVSNGAVAVEAPAPAPVPALAPAPATSTATGRDGAPLGAELVKTGLYLITGGGGNSLLRLSAIGAILVDGKREGQHRALMAQVRRISRLSDLPVRVLVLTDHHPHHADNVAQFRAAGVAVLAQAHARPRLPVTTPATPPASGAKLPGPLITFDREYRLRMGGVSVDLFHFGSAHTDNDTVVWFPDLKVLAVGDLFTADTPVPDLAAGGSFAGWASALEQMLKLDFELVVPSLGPIVHRAELLSLKSRIDALATSR